MKPWISHHLDYAQSDILLRCFFQVSELNLKYIWLRSLFLLGSLHKIYQNGIYCREADTEAEKIIYRLLSDPSKVPDNKYYLLEPSIANTVSPRIVFSLECGNYMKNSTFYTYKKE